MIEIIFTGKLCTVNQRYNKNFSLTDEYRIFKYLLGEAAKKAARKARHTIYPKESILYCSIWFSFNREKDIDSIVKPVLDSLQGIIYENDKSIKRLFIEKHKSSTKTEQVSIRIDAY